MAPIGVGDVVPDGTISFYDENDQLQTVSVHSLGAGKKAILFNVPGGFTSTCSMKLEPGFIEKTEELKSKGVDEIICFSVNDQFVMKAWGETYPENKHVKFVSDGSGEYTHLLGLELDLKDKGIAVRSSRFALLLDNLKVTVAIVDSGHEGPFSQLESIKMMMMPSISNLPRDLVEEIVYRVPSMSIRSVRLTCKKWNGLFKSRSFMEMCIAKEEAAAKELAENRMIVILDYNVRLMGIAVNDNPSIKSLGKLTCLEDSEQVKISQVFHCEGLLLCILKDDDWNPSLGHTRWIQTRSASAWKGRDYYKYALGYKNNSGNRSCRSFKILRFTDEAKVTEETDLPVNPALRFEIYDFDSDSWSTLDVSPHWLIGYDRGVSLKGNTYWSVERKVSPLNDHIICFDFTRERFGPLLPLPFSAWGEEFASLSCVREEKIAALLQSSKTYNYEVWITTKIEANNVSWIKFFSIDGLDIEWDYVSHKSFFIDEEKKVVVVFNKEGIENTVEVIGEVGCLKKWRRLLPEPCWPIVCSYVPSTVQIKQHKGVKRKEQSD
ncbi:PREDICTED: peroxiredoxin-2A-like [Camelina sativa]|uniref:glutaredoxin-dependent peroxiredoxin n=1 Tax=Camelina sativa TaxID=90675 RepID=A0ABM0UW34_CAMSA|nr:PREDICTED: peroxiredoxin-2A-like [Camelina sativa]